MKEGIEDHIILLEFRSPATKEKAFNSLLHKYQQRLYWHIRRMVNDHEDSDDILQEVFIKVWRSLDNFREDAQLYTWLYRIATNESITFLNKKKKTGSVSYDDVSNHVAEAYAETPSQDGDQIQRKLQAAIDTLPDKQKLVFNMKYFQDMKYDEMSEILGTSVGALKASYHIAVKKIEEYLTR